MTAARKSWHARAGAAALMILAICGAANAEDETGAKPHVNDPFQPMNRVIYNFNKNFFDPYILIPLIKFHNRAIPRPARISMRNFFENLREPVTLGNDLLQLRPKAASETAARFGINTTIGLAGLRDLADGWGFHRTSEDFGQTLGSYGIPQGPYLVLPVLGSSSVRDLSGRVVDEFLDPLHYVTFQNSTYWMLGKDGATLVESRAHKTKAAMRQGHTLSIDYKTDRDRYTVHAQNEAYNRPDEDEDYETSSPAPTAPSDQQASLTAPAGAKPPVSATDAVTAMKADFQRLNLRVTNAAIDGSTITVQIQPLSNSGPLRCDQIWQSVNFGAITGIDTVTVVDPSGDARYNCTKFLNPTPPPPAEPPPNGAPQGLPGA